MYADRATPQDHQQQVSELVAGYRRSREQLADVHRELGSVSVTRSSPDGSVTVTVDAQGRLTGLRLTDDAYRLHRPHRMGELVTELTRTAGEVAAERCRAVVAPVLPSGADPDAVLAGRADLTPAETAPVSPAASVVSVAEPGRRHTPGRAGGSRPSRSTDDDPETSDRTWLHEVRVERRS